MTGIPTAEEIEAAKTALQANAEDEAKKQATSSTGDIVSGALDIAGGVTVDVIGAAVGTVLEGAGSVATATGEAVVTVIGGIFDGLSS
ncbi:hypothetical protein [Bosea thiooxidans]